MNIVFVEDGFLEQHGFYVKVDVNVKQHVLCRLFYSNYLYNLYNCTTTCITVYYYFILIKDGCQFISNYFK